MDNVEKLLSQIKNDIDIMKVKFTARFLDNAADVLEKHGFGTCKTFLHEKQSRDEELRDQATAILRVLDKVEEYPDIKTNRKVMRLIIKALISLKSQREEER